VHLLNASLQLLRSFSDPNVATYVFFILINSPGATLCCRLL